MSKPIKKGSHKTPNQNKQNTKNWNEIEKKYKLWIQCENMLNEFTKGEKKETDLCTRKNILELRIEKRFVNQ